jgi:drug/metabolite transporter (DMT)-like permease
MESIKINKKLAYLFLMITVCAWGSLYVVGKFVLGYVPPFTVLFIRYLIASIFLIVFLKRSKPKKIERKDYKYIFFIGAVGYFLGIGSQMVGMKLANASLASLINSTNPSFIILFAVPILKEKITLNKIVSVTAAVIGVCIIIGNVGRGGQILGILASILSVTAWSLMSVMVRRVAQKYDPLAITTYGILIALFCTLPVSAFELAATKNVVIFKPSVILALLYMGIVCTALAHMLWNRSLSMIEAGNCALFYPLQPMVSVLLGFLFLGESISLTFVIGAVLILGGVLFSVANGRAPIKSEHRT